MNKFLFILLFLSNGSYAGLFDSKLQAYDCNTNSCDSSCKKLEGVFFEFKTNKEQRFVLMSAFNNGNSNSGALQNCSIIDSKNWSCDERGSSGLITQSSMTNGVFKSMTLLSLGNKTSQTYVCAK